MKGAEATRQPAKGTARTPEEEPPLSVLLQRMRSSSEDARSAAWGEIYQRYQSRVWSRVYYVIRTIPWLREPREVASDVTTQVFVGLPEAAARYKEMGRAEQWLLRVALRTALRHKEKLTGNWADGGQSDKGPGRGRPRPSGRRYLDLDDVVHEISGLMDEVESDERLELRRRLDAWKSDPGKARWLEHVELFLEGYTHDEIAERLGITSGTSRTWMWQIRQELGRPDVSDEVEGRDGRTSRDDEFVRPISRSAGPHLDEELLERSADGLLDAAEDAAARAHLASCALCGDRVTTLRRGLMVLALATEPPADLKARIEGRRAAGERPLLPVESGDADAPGLDEVVGRGTDDEAGEP